MRRWRSFALVSGHGTFDPHRFDDVEAGEAGGDLVGSVEHGRLAWTTPADLWVGAVVAHHEQGPARCDRGRGAAEHERRALDQVQIQHDHEIEVLAGRHVVGDVGELQVTDTPRAAARRRALSRATSEKSTPVTVQPCSASQDRVATLTTGHIQRPARCQALELGYQEPVRLGGPHQALALVALVPLITIHHSSSACGGAYGWRPLTTSSCFHRPLSPRASATTWEDGDVDRRRNPLVPLLELRRVRRRSPGRGPGVALRRRTAPRATT